MTLKYKWHIMHTFCDVSKFAKTQYLSREPWLHTQEDQCFVSNVRQCYIFFEYIFQYIWIYFYFLIFTSMSLCGLRASLLLLFADSHLRKPWRRHQNIFWPIIFPSYQHSQLSSSSPSPSPLTPSSPWAATWQWVMWCGGGLFLFADTEEKKSGKTPADTEALLIYPFTILTSK